VVSQVAERMAILMRQCLVQFFVNEGRPGPTAEYLGNELGRQIEEVFVRELGGARLVIPTLKCLETRERHRQIRNRFTGANHKELACEFGYSIPTIYDILRKDEPEGEV
jgi:Mor family transcriptional regulator